MKTLLKLFISCFILLLFATTSSAEIIVPDQIITYEGEEVYWETTIVGWSGGNVQISASSEGLRAAGTAGVDSQQYMDGEPYTWTFTADVHDEVTDDEKEYTITVTANGGVGGQFGATETEHITLIVRDIDSVHEDTKAVVTVKAIDVNTGELMEDAPIYIVTGISPWNRRTGMDLVTSKLLPDITYYIYSEDTRDYLSQYTASSPYVFHVYPELNQKETIIIKFDRGTRPIESTPVTEQSPGFSLMISIFSVALIAMFSKRQFHF